MGQKTQPIGFRLGINRTWDSRWFSVKSYGDLLHQDIELRKYLFEKLKAAAVSKIVIERPAGRARISIYAGRPGLVMKRFHARARGRGAKIIKPFSHLTILLSEQEGN